MTMPHLAGVSTPVDRPTAATVTALPGARVARARHYLMCRPTYFEVSYAINPWMDPSVPVDTDRAMRQWENLVATYRDLGHTVSLIEPVPGLPDMVFAANGALVVDGKVLGSNFLAAERHAEGPAYLGWLGGTRMFGALAAAAAVNEGEGDFLNLRGCLLAGTGFRTEPAAHAEAQEFFGKPVISLRLIDPRFYHLDTALAVLDDDDVAYYPGAFSPGSRAVLERMFPDAITMGESEAATFALNSVSDGRHVVVPAESTDFAARLAERGFEPIAVELDEFRKAGGGPKCCTLELRP